MFTDLGLNIARQRRQRRQPAARQPQRLAGRRDARRRRGLPRHARGRRVRPASRSACGTRPSSCASPRRSRVPPRPDGAPNRWPRGRGMTRHPGVASNEIDELGLTRRMRLVSGPQGPRVVLDGKPVLLLCSNNYLGLADHPRVREAAADAAMRWGVGAGASRLVSGTMTIHRRLEERARRVQGPRGRAAVRLRLPREHRRRLARSPAAARSSSPTSSTTPRSSTAAASRAPRRSSTATTTSTTSPGACSRRAPRARSS